MQLAHDDGDLGIPEERGKQPTELLAELFRREPRRSHFTDQRQRDHAVRPDRHGAGDLGISEHHDFDHILDAEDVPLLRRHANRCGGEEYDDDEHTSGHAEWHGRSPSRFVRAPLVWGRLRGFSRRMACSARNPGALFHIFPKKYQVVA